VQPPSFAQALTASQNSCSNDNLPQPSIIGEVVLSTAARVQPPKVAISNASAPITFAQALTTSQNTSTNDNLPQPSNRGVAVSIRISQAPYEKGVEVCKRNIHGRLVLSKGDKSYIAKDIQLKLQKDWKTTIPWTLLSLGKGYYEFFFASETDLCTVWAMRTINMKPRVLRLFEWTKDFNMHNQKNTHAQVWIRSLALPQDYWMERTLQKIACAVAADTATSKRIFVHYARALFDMDFSNLVYEWLPDFCTYCQKFGHDVTTCRWLYPRKENIVNKERVNKEKSQIPAKKFDWVPIQENPSGVGSFKAFEVPPSESTAHNCPYSWRCCY